MKNDAGRNKGIEQAHNVTRGAAAFLVLLWKFLLLFLSEL